MRRWINDRTAMTKLLLWMCLARPILHLHYNLFSSGKLHGKSHDGVQSVWAYSLRTSSLPCKIVEKLARCFDEAWPAHQRMWDLALAFLGEMRNWTADLVHAAVVIVHMTMGHLWRRFVLRLSSFPWLLSPLCLDDADVPRGDKIRLAQQFMQAKECCIDDMFSARLRATIPSAEALVDDNHIVGFLKHSLQQAHSTTSHIEDGFAHMRRHLNLGWRAPSMATVAAQHVLAEHQRVHGAWLRSLKSKPHEQERKRRQSHTPKPGRRPIWVWSKRRRVRSSVNAYNEFISHNFEDVPGPRRGALARLGQMWRQLPPASKAQPRP